MSPENASQRACDASRLLQELQRLPDLEFDPFLGNRAGAEAAVAYRSALASGDGGVTPAVISDRDAAAVPRSGRTLSLSSS